MIVATFDLGGDTCPDCLMRRDACQCAALDRASAERAPRMDRDDDITRAQVENRWRVAKLEADRDGFAKTTPASAAGQYLEAAGGDPQAAYRLVPPDAGGRFWTRVRSILARL